MALVGDAAGLVDPLSGEGIGNAFRSARMAAAAVSRLLSGEAPDLRDYERALERSIEPDLAIARQLADLLQDHPWPYVQIMRRSGWFRGLLCRIVRGEDDYQGMRARLGPPRAPVRARRAPGRAQSVAAQAARRRPGNRQLTSPLHTPGRAGLQC